MSVKTKGILCTPQYEIISFRDLLALAWLRLALLDSIHFLQTPDLRLPCPAHADARSGNVGSSQQLALDKGDKDVAMPSTVFFYQYPKASCQAPGSMTKQSLNCLIR